MTPPPLPEEPAPADPDGDLAAFWADMDERDRRALEADDLRDLAEERRRLDEEEDRRLR